jgi:hypothetical protein
MADNVPITPGTGASISTEEVTTLNGVTVASQHVQRAAIALRTADATAIDVSGDAANGIDVDVTRLPTLANVTTLGTITNVVHVDDNSGTLTVDGTVAVSSLPTVTINSPAVTNAGTFAVQESGAVLTALQVIDNIVSGNEAQVDIVAALPAGDNNIGVVIPHALPADFVSGATSDITDTTATSVIAADATKRIYVTSILVTNSHATVGTFVNITDGSGGAVLWTGYAAAAGGGFACTFPVPIRTTAATALFCVCVTTGANVRVCAAGYEAA